jgi:hypothetical protein
LKLMFDYLDMSCNVAVKLILFGFFKYIYS